MDVASSLSSGVVTPTICVAVEPDSLSELQATLESVSRNTLCPPEVIVGGFEVCRGAIERILDSPGLAFRCKELVCFDTGGDLLWGLLDFAASHGKGHGAMFVCSGVRVPYGWDARLLRIADDKHNIGTVSPLCRRSPIFSPLIGQLGRDHFVADANELDKLVFYLSNRGYVETPCALHDCFYISEPALRLVTDSRDQRADPSGSATRQLSQILVNHGYLNVLTDCLFVDLDNVGHTLQRQIEQSRCMVGFSASRPLVESQNRITEAIALGVSIKKVAGVDGKPVQLHVIHSWGGGMAKWVRDYCRADSERDNLVLKSFGTSKLPGERLELYSHPDDRLPIRVWHLSLPIQATAISHLEYQRALTEIIDDYGIDSILVSSLIGHSLDVLNTTRKTVVVFHDYYPFCQAINLYFGEICTDCERKRLIDCSVQNPLNTFAELVEPDRWILLRDAYLDFIRLNVATLVAPSQSVISHLCQLDARFSKLTIHVIPHGTSPVPATIEPATRRDNSRLRVVVLGRLAKQKGQDLLSASYEELTEFADLFLVGCGEEGGGAFRGRYGVTIITGYDEFELPKILGGINADVGLLVSIVPETFSYTLSELMALGIPVVATSVGSYRDRISPNISGFLVDPTPAAVVAKLRALAESRKALAVVRRSLTGAQQRSPAEMVRDYHRLVPFQRYSSARFRVHNSVYGQEQASLMHAKLSVDTPFSQFLREIRVYLNAKIFATRRLNKWQQRLLAKLLGSFVSVVERVFA